jgi:hypothetical protein
VRIAPEVLRTQPNNLEHLGGALLASPTSGMSTCDLQSLRDNVANLHPRVEGAQRVLEDHLNVAPHCSQRLAGGLAHVLAAEQDGSRSRLHETDDGAAQCALAAPGLPDQTQGLTRPYRQGDAIDGFHSSGDPPQGAVPHWKVRLEVT